MLTEELLALANAGGAALVAAVATDGSNAAKRGIARLFGRGDQHRVAVIEERLERTRSEVEAAGPNAELVRLQHQAAWAGRSEDLLADHPDTAAELRALVRQMAAASGTSSVGPVIQHVVASDNARQAVQGHGTQSNVFGRDTPESVVVHRLVQAVARDQLNPTAAEELRTRVATVLGNAEPGDPRDPENWPAWTRLLPHLTDALRKSIRRYARPSTARVPPTPSSATASTRSSGSFYNGAEPSHGQLQKAGPRPRPDAGGAAADGAGRADPGARPRRPSTTCSSVHHSGPDGGREHGTITALVSLHLADQIVVIGGWRDHRTGHPRRRPGCTSPRRAPTRDRCSPQPLGAHTRPRCPEPPVPAICNLHYLNALSKRSVIVRQPCHPIEASVRYYAMSTRSIQQ